MSKNIQKVQDMLDGNYKNKIQSGYTHHEKHREVGEKWTDSDGYEWEQKKGYRMKISKTPSMGIGDQCKDCESFILKPWDKHVYKADGRCRICQINFEAELKSSVDFNGKGGIRWFAYRRLKDLQNMESIHNDMEKYVFEKHEMLKENPFDKTIANAIANENVEMTINKNKTMS